MTEKNFKDEDRLRREICAVGQLLERRGFITATEGNLSVRLQDGRILISPSGACKCEIQPSDLLVLDSYGRKLSGEGSPSSELAMHLLFYKRRDDVRAVCHAHPPTATGFAAARMPLDEALLTEVIIALGTVPLAEFALPGTEEVAASLEPFVMNHDAMLLANHGVVTCGVDLTSAFHHMEMVEHFARIAVTARILGRPALLSNRDVDALIASRERYGVKLPKSTPRPRTAEDLAANGNEAVDERISLTRRELEALIAEVLAGAQHH